MKRKGEQQVNDRIRESLTCYHPQRIEDLYSTGVPDINFTGGWLESKDIPEDRAPKKPGAIVKLDHYTSKQRAWHVHREQCGGRVYVALEVADEFFVIRGALAAQHLGVDWTLDDLRAKSVLYMPTWDGRRFRQFIKLDCGLP